MRILIVEDEEKIAHSLKTLLEKDGNAVDYVLDGETGERRAILRRDDYDFLIFDLILPGKNGIDVCKALRSRGITTPILMLTGQYKLKDRVLALNSGADDYLLKPFSVEELLARMHAIRRRPAGAIVEILQIRDLTLNTRTREVQRGDRTIKLTLKEYELLNYLMCNPDKAINREDIFAHLWDFTSNSMSNVIDVHMKNLRRKLDPQNENTFIETVRGFGYKIKS